MSLLLLFVQKVSGVTPARNLGGSRRRKSWQEVDEEEELMTVVRAIAADMLGEGDSHGRA